MQTAPFAEEKQVSAAHWRLQWEANAAAISSTAREHYKEFILQNLLASLRDVNWQSDEAARILRRNRDFSADFVSRASGDLSTAYAAVPWFLSVMQAWMIGGLGSPLLSDVLYTVVLLPPEEKASDGGWLAADSERWKAHLSDIIGEAVS